jgi:hypothetical protein
MSTEMEESAPDASAWSRALLGLGFVRRGTILVAASGLLILLLGATARAGCANPHLPEVRSLMEYQSLVFHLALWLGFVLVIGGLGYAALMPTPWSTRSTILTCAGLVSIAFISVAAVSSPTRIIPLNAPPGTVGQIVVAAVTTLALAGNAAVAMAVAGLFGESRRFRAALSCGLAGLATVALHTEALAGWLFPDPVDALYLTGGVIAVDTLILWWLRTELLHAEKLIRARLPTE